MRLGVKAGSFERSHPPAKSRGSVLIGVLWCVALLSIVVTGVLQTSRVDLRVAKNHGDSIQAHYLALAGIEKAKALLFHDAADRRTSQENHSSELSDSPNDFRDVKLGRVSSASFGRLVPTKPQELFSASLTKKVF
jgi:hypothetical protein